jgi:hypothetical protein
MTQESQEPRDHDSVTERLHRVVIDEVEIDDAESDGVEMGGGPAARDDEPFVPRPRYRMGRSTKVMACVLLVAAGAFGGVVVQKAVDAGTARTNRSAFVNNGGQNQGAFSNSNSTGNPTGGAGQSRRNRGGTGATGGAGSSSGG